VNSPNIRSILVLKTLELIPPLVSKTLLESSDFRDDYGLQTEAVLEINNMGIQIQRSDLYIAVRKILTSEGTVESSLSLFSLEIKYSLFFLTLQYFLRMFPFVCTI
jgi:hypothetical protein